MKTLKILLVVCSLLISISSFADSDKHEKKHYKYKKNYFSKNLDFLDLNKQQYQRIRDVLVSYKNDYKEFYEYQLIKKRELRTIMQKNIFDKDKYIKIDTEIKLRASILEAMKFDNIHTVLNKEQRIKFSYYLEEWEVE